MNINEGGNVFKDSAGTPLTQRIAQADVMPTVKWLEGITGLDLTSEKAADGNPVKWLGSTGRKVDSGDLDLSVDAGEMSKDQLTQVLTAWAQKQKVDPARYIKKTGSAVHFFAAIGGNPANGFVQTDFMFSNKPRWTQFVLSNDPASRYKGALRNIMLNSMAKSLGYKLNQNDGIMNRVTNELITDDPAQVAKMLLSPNATTADLSSVEAVMRALEADPKKPQKIADFKAHMEREGIPFDDGLVKENTELYTEYNEVSMMARLRDRIVNQGMQVIVEGVRIEHPEDMIFDQRPSAGLKQALAGIMAAAERPQETTVKWDGKPAIIFGRKPSGEFVLTDKSGFLAKGYDGLATSPEHIAKIMAQRGGERGELVAIYQRLFPMLRRAVPQDFRGYIQGDLLYSSTPQRIGNQWVFQPNTVKYAVPVDSDLGKKIADSTAAVAIHTSLSAPGAPAEPIRAAALADSPGLLILDPSLKDPRQIKLDAKTVADANRLLSQYGAAMDRLFDPTELRARKISNFPALIKTYINSRVRSGSYDNLVSGFGSWIQQQEPAKAPRIFEWATENKQAVAALFQAFIEVSSLKNQLVRQLDSQSQAVQASINDEPGHEGYVGQGMKFVDRMRFSAANFAKNNPELG
jgi:hypothetical protein